LARVQEYAGRPADCLRTCQEAVELARRAEDVRLQAALQLRLADTLERLGDPAAAALHRGAAERLLAGEIRPPGPADASTAQDGQDGTSWEQAADACEIRSTPGED
ncbi:hypothetical protein G3I35_25090, partial [Streptomyces sp. SID10815]|nr:hypothetical protein [Streptomyces sp. SID10815]